VNKKFKVLMSDGNYEEFPVTRLLWMIQEDVEKISNDRLLRFQSKSFSEYRPTPLGNEIRAERTSITIGEIVIANSPKSHQSLLGIVIKFRKKLTSQKQSAQERKFVYTSLIFGTNKNVEFLLHPCYSIVDDFSLVRNEDWDYYLDESNYVATVNENYVNFEDLKISEEVFEGMQ
jgi:hypothetical protein